MRARHESRERHDHRECSNERERGEIEERSASHGSHFRRTQEIGGIKRRAKTMQRHEQRLTTDPACPDADVPQHASVTSRAQLKR
jgi:hypothetical protein